MTIRIRYHNLDPAEATGAGPSADEHAIDQPHDGTLADSAIDETENQVGDADPILGVGPNHSAGGLSGDGKRTDEYDAAVMGIGD